MDFSGWIPNSFFSGTLDSNAQNEGIHKQIFPIFAYMGREGDGVLERLS